MKHLKKLSVVLMLTTLFSVTFTSCIDNEVSDAVDQVYLAQADFLRAQAALQNAKAQGELAEAAYTNAQAAYELARVKQMEATVAGMLLNNAETGNLNAYNAQIRVNSLALAAAELEVALQGQLTALATAQSAYDVAMVNLGEAVAAAKDILILGYYADYSVVVAELQELYVKKVNAEHDLALKELMLVSLSGDTTDPIDLVSRAYFQALLENDLAKLQGELAAEQANLAMWQATTAADASDPAKAITALEAQIAALQVQYDAKVIEHAESLVAVDVAYKAWEASTAKYEDLGDAEELLVLAKAAKKAHTDAIVKADAAIAKAASNVAALPALVAAAAAVDTTTAFNAVVAAKANITAKQALVGTNYTNDNPDDIKDPKITDAPKVVVTAWDKVWNAELLAKQKNATYDSISKYLASSIVLGSPYVYLNELELNLVSAINAVSGTLPASIAEAQAIYNAALLRETAAQAAFNASPSGSTWTDGVDSDISASKYDNSFVGDHTDGAIATSYKRVATWVQLPGGSGDYYPATYTTSATIPALPTSGTITYAEFDATVPLTLAQTTNTNLVYYVEVEEDDSETVNVTEMHLARYYARIAEDNLNTLLGNSSSEIQTVADARFYLDLGYKALGYTIPPVGDPLTSDWNKALALQAAALKAKNDAIAAIGYATNSFGSTIDTSDNSYTTAEKAKAYYQVILAQAAVVTAQTDLGIDFRNAWTGNSWTSRFGEWYATASTTQVTAYTPFTNIATGVYQPLKKQVGVDGTDPVYARSYVLPHVGTTAVPLNAYQKLRNAYFQMVWAKEAVDAAGFTSYKRLYVTNLDGVIASPTTASYTNAKATEYATADKAILTALLPSHDFAIAYLQGEFDRLAALYNLDLTNWDLEGGHGLGEMLLDLPAYAVYLDAVRAAGDVLAEFTSINNQVENLEFMIDAYAFVQSGNFSTDGTNVKDFMDTVADAIESSEDAIADLNDSIEIQKGFVATGIVDQTTANAWVAEYERRIEVLETKIAGFESAAANLLARITALLG